MMPSQRDDDGEREQDVDQPEQLVDLRCLRGFELGLVLERGVRVGGCEGLGPRVVRRRR